ncbi:hypothetical protein [Kitasatospora aureofaciens]|uniref:DUF7144 family membrane protein n=1 Tax=Kitasatospora aureofaciens TaxID=1894 RepID=UPI001C469115|nr:hypothetical protein [Kitasatospora aureofaciens]MBV6696355.1 hypothetical protein [Kitasatospora aureofaciens]
MSSPTSPANSGWVTGGVVFAGVVMMLNGVLDVFRGIMAVAKDDVFVNTPNYVFRFSLTSWGWIHLIVGLLLAATGYFVVTGSAWARYVGILLASLSAAECFLSLPYYPLWGLIVITLDVFVIWALCVYRPETE